MPRFILSVIVPALAARDRHRLRRPAISSIIEPCRPWLSWVGLHCLWGVDAMPVMANFFGIEPCRPWLSSVGLHCLWGVDGRLSVPVVRLAKRIFVNCHRSNDLWPSSMRFRAPSETHPHTLELTPARHALRQAIVRCDRARREADAAAIVVGRLNAITDEHAATAMVNSCRTE